MVFSSLSFAYLFLPLAIGIYYIAKEDYRNIILVICSILFYSFGEPRNVFLLLASITVNYIVALRIKGKHKTGVLVGGVLFNLAVLLYFKYVGFVIQIISDTLSIDIQWKEIKLPIGISFFTFQAISYLVDVYREEVEPQKNIVDLALYISFFPQLIAGPIVRYRLIEKQIRNRSFEKSRFSYGIQRFMWGFEKKVLIANNLSYLAEEVFTKSIDNAKQMNPLFFWFGSVAFSLQIYYDFSGYSDMAIGLGKIFGFDFEENFNYPYIADSITDFWRRWHISLSQWFRDYVYIPLGGSRKNVPRHILNIFVVWLLTGIWHGAGFNFIVWGMGYFVLLIIEKYFVKPKERVLLVRIFWRIVTLICINSLWVIFNSTTLTNGIRFIKAMLGFYGTKVQIDERIMFWLSQYGVVLVLGLILVTPITNVLRKKLENSKCYYISYLEPILCGILFLISVSYIIMGSNNPFLYFNF